MHNGLPLGLVLIGFVSFFAVAAVLIKSWEKHELKKMNNETIADHPQI